MSGFESVATDCGFGHGLARPCPVPSGVQLVVTVVTSQGFELQSQALFVYRATSTSYDAAPGTGFQETIGSSVLMPLDVHVIGSPCGSTMLSPVTAPRPAS